MKGWYYTTNSISKNAQSNSTESYQKEPSFLKAEPYNQNKPWISDNNKNKFSCEVQDI